MTAFHPHHEWHPADTTTCHRNLAIGMAASWNARAGIRLLGVAARSAWGEEKPTCLAAGHALQLDHVFAEIDREFGGLDFVVHAYQDRRGTAVRIYRSNEPGQLPCEVPPFYPVVQAFGGASSGVEREVTSGTWTYVVADPATVRSMADSFMAEGDCTGRAALANASNSP